MLSLEFKTDPECNGYLTEWLQRLGMVTILWKISICLPGLYSLIDSIDRLKIKVSYVVIYFILFEMYLT